jgi:hypothetical protein
MSRIKFYFEKIHFLLYFIWRRNWGLVRDEWNLTYEQLAEAEGRSDEICREAAERVLARLQEEYDAQRSQIGR